MRNGNVLNNRIYRLYRYAIYLLLFTRAIRKTAREWIHLPPPEFCYTLYPTLYFLKSVVYDGNTLLKTLKTPQFPQHSKWQIFTQFPQNVRKNA